MIFVERDTRIGFILAINSSQPPYESWQELKVISDRRARTTQAMAATKQQLSQPEFQRTINRVNPGPNRNTRAQLAVQSSEVPHVLAPEDMWGWQQWAQGQRSSPPQSTIAPGLVEEVSQDSIPGANYAPIGPVKSGSVLFCGQCSRRRIY